MKDLLRIHAGCVVRSGGAVLLPGPGCSGKSTLVTSLLTQGFSFLSDDDVGIDPESFCAHPASRPIFLRDDAFEVLPESIRSRLVRHSDEVWRLDEDQLERLRHREPAPVVAIVALDPNRQHYAQLVKIGQLEAITHLLQQCRSFDEFGPAAISILVALAKRSKLFRLSQGNLDETTGLLTKHLP
jgi:hypothetical protein